MLASAKRALIEAYLEAIHWAVLAFRHYLQFAGHFRVLAPDAPAVMWLKRGDL